MNNEKKKPDKPPSLSAQNNNLKDYIIAMNYYLQSRCKDFTSLLRDLPERALIKEIGDLVTIYEFIKEDFNYYRNTISQFEIDQTAINENMLKMQKHVEQCKADYQSKIDNEIKTYENYHRQINEEMQLKEKTFKEEIASLKEKLDKEQKGYQNRLNECNRLIELNNAYKKQIQNQTSEFQNELMTLQNLIQVQKEKYLKESRINKENSESLIRQLRKQNEERIKEMEDQNENVLKYYKKTCQSLQNEMVERQEQFQAQQEIYLRTKAILEMSQLNLHENDLEIKRLNEIITAQKIASETSDTLICQQKEEIEILKQKITQLNKQLQETIEFNQIREQKWNSSVNDLMLEIEFVCTSVNLPKMQFQNNY